MNEDSFATAISRPEANHELSYPNRLPQFDIREYSDIGLFERHLAPKSVLGLLVVICILGAYFKGLSWVASLARRWTARKELPIEEDGRRKKDDELKESKKVVRIKARSHSF